MKLAVTARRVIRLVQVAGIASTSHLAAIPGAAHAQDAIFWPEPVDTVRVVAPRPFPEERIVRPRGFVQVVPLDRSMPPTCDLGDLLDRTAGVQVRRYGGLGSPSLASVRGSSPTQVQVFIDEIPLSTAPDAMANLALLPVRLFDRLEIARGPLATSESGSGAGVIRLVSPEHFDLPLRVRAGIGSFGTTSLAATAGATRGPFAFMASGGRLSTNGDYAYLDRNGTPWEPDDDRTVRRSNNAFRQEDLLAHGRMEAGANVKVDLTGHGLWKDAGIPGTENLQTKNVHDRFRRVMQGLAARGGDPRGFAWNVSAHRQEDTDRYRNPDGEVGLGRTETRSRLLAVGFDGGAALAVVPLRADARYSGSFLEERFRLVDLLKESAEPIRVRRSRSLGIEAAVRPAGRRLDLFGLARWTAAQERGTRDRSFATPRAGFSLSAGHGIGLRGSWGAFGRLPSFVELYGQNGVQLGNAALVPERGHGWDLGVTVRAPAAPADPRLRAQLEIACFDTATRDAIVWLQNSQRTSRAQNIERTRVRGVETFLRAAWRPGHRGRGFFPGGDVTATFTLQDPRDTGPTRTYRGKLLPQLPERQGSVETRIAARAIRLTHTLDYESAVYRDRYNSDAKRRGPRVLHDLEAAATIVRGRLDASVSVRNLTDQRTQDVEGFPLPGRSVFLQLTASAPTGGRP